MGEAQKLGLVFVGAGVGGVLRYLAQQVATRFVPGFPWGTLAINILGSFLIGLYFGWERGRSAGMLRLLVPIGLLGGFTTFSALSLETLQMFEAGRIGPGVGYVLLSVVLGLLFCYFGSVLTR